MAQYVTAIVCVSEILFFSASIPCIPGTDIDISIKDILCLGEQEESASKLYDNHTYFADFEKDLSGADRSALIVSPYLQKHRITSLLPIMESAIASGTRVIVHTKTAESCKPDQQAGIAAAIAMLEGTGITIITREERQQPYAVMDDGHREGRYIAGYDPATGKQLIKNELGKTQAEVKETLKRAMEEIVGLDTSRADDHTAATMTVHLVRVVRQAQHPAGHAKPLRADDEYLHHSAYRQY